MTLDATAFRAVAPEFGDPVAYPDATITGLLGVATLRLDATRWGGLLDYGTQLFVAHNLILARKAAIAASVGGLPGAAEGVVASKSVAGVSKSYDNSVGMVAGAGQYNLTTPGRQFYELVRLVGMGGTQLSGEQAVAGSILPGGWTAGFLLG